ncbi:MAG: DUF1837 domain-containing protein [Candidatus Moranbacteria bacterium]|nr:DUF1837 domain-containing protein [Candidatus Moranbacteria bacterium]
MIETSTNTENSDFLQSFSHVIKGRFLDEAKKTKLDLFVLNISANEFDYETFKTRLVDLVVDFALSRKVKNKYKDKPVTLANRAKDKFKKGINRGELGEFLLFCFLENHLKAPKILTKLELKTSTSTYVHGSDGVHFLKLDNGNFQLIFGESKTKLRLTDALSDAFQSIHEFKTCRNTNGNTKSGLPYEKCLINDEIEKEAFSKEEMDFIERLIYPRADSEFEVDDAFGIFVGYDIQISEDEKKLPNFDFRRLIEEKIIKEVENKIPHISKKINEYDLTGHHFYIYIMPFTQLKINRKDITGHITA